MLVAIVREPGAALPRCDLVHRAREPIDVALAVRQHRAYCARLVELGVRAIALAPESELADAAFVEDVLVVLDEAAVVARPASEARRAEVERVTDAVRPYRRVLHIDAPGTLEGGDVLPVGDVVYLGLSTRTNLEGYRQLERLLLPYGYRIEPVEVARCLHLKTGCSFLGRGTVLVNPNWVALPATGRLERIEVHPDEPYAANALRVGETVLMADSCPRTVQGVRERGFAVVTVEVAELMKAEAGPSCLSVLFAAEEQG
ncbi:MAG: dimethylargininase [Deltaproteobacteria bacterium]|nr:dimethylargininase [Deltaproteobacteria bacterium]